MLALVPSDHVSGNWAAAEEGSRRGTLCVSTRDTDAVSGMHIQHKFLHGDARTSRHLNGDFI